MTDSPKGQQGEQVIQQSEDVRWQSVMTRDSGQDGQFVYGVSSTGIYCRPSCPSRRPARSRVRFFGSPIEAESAGFRACLRCRPADPMDAGMLQVKLAREYLERHAGETCHPETTGRGGPHESLSPAKEVQAGSRTEPQGLCECPADGTDEVRAPAGRHRQSGHLRRGLRFGQPRLRACAILTGHDPRRVSQRR